MERQTDGRERWKVNAELCSSCRGMYDGGRTGVQTVKQNIRKFLSKIVFWSGIAVAGILAVPAAVLILIICGVWTAADSLISRLERDNNNGCL